MGEAERISQKEAIRGAEAKVYSQFNEDGILKYLLDRLETPTRRFVEFGIQNGKECNTANLSIHAGWSGLLMDGNPSDVEKARAYYAQCIKPDNNRVTIKHAFITAENINEHLKKHAAAGGTDLLSLDIDGNDLWVWRAMEAIDPPVVVIEYAAVFGLTRSISTKYDPSFERFRYHATGLYQGASLPALAKVRREKGYILVGCESHGVNAFFVKSEHARAAALVELSPQEAFYEHAWRAARFGSIESQFELIKHLEFTEV
jgi:hypothetical protein